jgi:drug/metabolite transporter (DMT)-like permease
VESGLEQQDALRSWAERTAVAVLAGSAAVAVAGLVDGSDAAAVHAVVAAAGAAVAWTVARRWPPPPVPPERLARAVVVGAFLLVGIAQLLAGVGTWVDVAESAGAALSRLAFPLALVAAVAGFAALLARSRRDGRRW